MRTYECLIHPASYLGTCKEWSHAAKPHLSLSFSKLQSQRKVYGKMSDSIETIINQPLAIIQDLVAKGEFCLESHICFVELTNLNAITHKNLL